MTAAAKRPRKSAVLQAANLLHQFFHLSDSTIRQLYDCFKYCCSISSLASNGACNSEANLHSSHAFYLLCTDVLHVDALKNIDPDACRLHHLF